MPARHALLAPAHSSLNILGGVLRDRDVPASAIPAPSFAHLNSYMRIHRTRVEAPLVGGVKTHIGAAVRGVGFDIQSSVEGSRDKVKVEGGVVGVRVDDEGSGGTFRGRERCIRSDTPGSSECWAQKSTNGRREHVPVRVL